MNWHRGIILNSFDNKIYKGLIQQIEGKPDLFILIELPDGNTIIQSEIYDWDEARSWIENKILELGEVNVSL